MTLKQGVPHLRGARLNCLATLMICVLCAPAAHALDAAQWQSVAPTLQTALECRATPDTGHAAWKVLPRDASGAFESITPPLPFTVFGLPVREVSIFIDTDGELGESYTAELAASAATVRKAAGLSVEGGRDTAMGSLMLTEETPPKLTCTVAGTYDESDYQEN